jgi:RNA polymerase sigma factor (sigma-70 family)
MRKSESEAKTSRPRRMVMAMMVGTALSSLGAAAAEGAQSRTVTDLSRYCTACWRNARLPADCWADCTQDVFVRLLERLPPAAWERALQVDGNERREFVRAIDTVKKRAQRAKHYIAWPKDGVAAPDDGDAADRREALEQFARDSLSERQRVVLKDTICGYSVPEIAERLGLTPERVSDEKYKAIRKLRDSLPVED